jgi:hydrogenase small subunit
MKANEGKYICVIEGAIPTRDDGIYCMIGGKTALSIVNEVAEKAGAIIAIGSCASWGGIPSADPNPTGATGAPPVLKGKPIVNIPGCPPNPYTLLGVVLQYAVGGTLPALDAEGRPKFAFDRTIHEHCPRRAHFDAGRFVQQFGDEGHRQGWCLYQMGCKGPVTHAGCSTRHFNEVPDVWPIGIGAPCVGCTERDIAFKVPIFDKAPILHPMPPATYPPIRRETGKIDPVAAAAAGVGVGAILGAAWAASRKFSAKEGDESVPGTGRVPPAGGREEGGPS